MRRVLPTLIATMAALGATFLYRDYVSGSFAGQSSNSLFTPWILLEACFVLFAALSLFFVVWHRTKSSAFLLLSACTYFVGILPTDMVFLQHPVALGDALATYTAVFLPQIAAVAAFLVVFFTSKSYAKL